MQSPLHPLPNYPTLIEAFACIIQLPVWLGCRFTAQKHYNTFLYYPCISLLIPLLFLFANCALIFTACWQNFPISNVFSSHPSSRRCFVSFSLFSWQAAHAKCLHLTLSPSLSLFVCRYTLSFAPFGIDFAPDCSGGCCCCCCIDLFR